MTTLERDARTMESCRTDKRCKDSGDQKNRGVLYGLWIARGYGRLFVSQSLKLPMDRDNSEA